MKKIIVMLITLCLLFSMMPIANAAESSVKLTAGAEETATLTFSDTSIEETVSGIGYTIDGTTLTVTSVGTYRVKGNCSEGSIVVSSKLSGVTLILDDLTLSSATTAPIVVKKNSTVTMTLEGSTTLSDNEDPASDGVDDNFEGAAVKVKSNSTLTICGDGTLNIKGNSKNGIKGSTESSLIVNGGTFNVTALNNGIASDGSLVINAGTFTVNSENDGIKSDPDEDDTTSAGTVEINGGTFTINVKGDGIQAGTTLTVNNGVFNITTLDGYQSKSFSSDTMSCKGLKASGNNPNDNIITITGGTFSLNTADDAVHSDGDIKITGGTFDIRTGDDGVHADTTLTLGTENGYERDPEISIYASYEGLEAGNIYAYSGKYYVTASDDGINAAGGSSNGISSNPGGDNFRPGGNNSRPGGNNFGPGNQGGNTSTGDYNMYIHGGDFYVNANGDGLDSNGGLYLYGGNVTVLSQASGGDNSPLDADGTIMIKGATVFAAGSNQMNETPSNSSQKYYSSRTNISAGKVVNVTINGSVAYSEKLLRNVNYILYSSPNMTTNSCTISQVSSIEKCKSNAWEHNWNEGIVTKEATTESAGVITYTCKDCGKTERKTIPMIFIIPEDKEPSIENPGEEEPQVVYTASFKKDGHARINIFYTQDYTAPNETDVTTAIARSSITGDADGSGDGQINFLIIPDEGYEVDSVQIEGSYKNLKDISADEGIENLYRITKITGDLIVTVMTKQSENNNDSGNEDDNKEEKFYTASFETDGYAKINVFYTQDYTTPSETDVTTAIARNSETGVADGSGDGQINFVIIPDDGYEVETVQIEGSYKNLKDISADEGIANLYRVTKITGDLIIMVTTKQSDNNEDSGNNDSGDDSDNEEEQKVYIASFETDGHARINVFYTQDYTTPSETDVTTAIARNSETGVADGSGDGQINFVIIPDDGYEVETVQIEGSYKNLKDVSADEGIDNLYRITKITSDLIVTVTTKKNNREPGYLLGDVNLDGNIDIRDVTLIQQYLASLKSLDDQQKAVADTDKNGIINIRDATTIQMYIANIITEF